MIVNKYYLFGLSFVLAGMAGADWTGIVSPASMGIVSGVIGVVGMIVHAMGPAPKAPVATIAVSPASVVTHTA